MVHSQEIEGRSIRWGESQVSATELAASEAMFFTRLNRLAHIMSRDDWQCFSRQVQRQLIVLGLPASVQLQAALEIFKEIAPQVMGLQRVSLAAEIPDKDARRALVTEIASELEEALAACRRALGED